MPKLPVFRRLLAYVRPYSSYLLISLGSLVVYALLSSAMLYLVKPLFAHLFESGIPPVTPDAGTGFDALRIHLDRWVESWIASSTTVGTLERIGILIVLVTVVKTVFYYINGWAITHMEQGVVKGLRDELYIKLHNLSLAYFDRHRTGHLVSRVTNDVSVVQETLATTLTQMVREPLMSFFYLYLLLSISWPLTLLAAVVVPVAAFLVARLGFVLRRYSASTQERMADVNDILEETITGMRVVKAFAMESFEIRKFKAATSAYFAAVIRMIKVRLLATPAGEVMGVVMVALVLWVGARQVYVEGTITPAEFITFLVLMFALGRPIKSLADVHIKLQRGLAAADRVFEVLDTVPAVADAPDVLPLVTPPGDITFDGVSFQYDTGDVVLKEISFTVAPGEVLAIVGPSGAGKSTVLDLIPRFYEPTAGSIRIGDQDLRCVKLESLRARMGIVTQEIILFNDSVARNIAYGVESADLAAIHEAAKMANAHEFIRALPDGYDSLIGQRGVLLSGGQRQRLAIARALMKDPDILIFDEATSALDSEAELQVQEAIDRLMARRTVFVVAHRLSTIQRADRIIVLDGGRVVEEGNHSTLYHLDGLYRYLYDLQFRSAPAPAQEVKL